MFPKITVLSVQDLQPHRLSLYRSDLKCSEVLNCSILDLSLYQGITSGA